MSNLKNNTTQLEALLAKVNALPETGGITLPALDNEGVAADLREGKELIDSQGNIITGTMADLTNFDTVTVRSGTEGYVNGVYVASNVDTIVPIAGNALGGAAFPLFFAFSFYDISITFTVERTGEQYSCSHHSGNAAGFGYLNLCGGGGAPELLFNTSDIIIITGTSSF